MEMSEAGAHILVFPYPAQGHMIPLLDLAHQLSSRGLAITILVTPQNLPLLDSFLSRNPSIKTLVLPFPKHPAIPLGVENVKDLPANGFLAMMCTLSELYDPIIQWFHGHPSPPVAIISDMFLGWTHKLACHLNIRRYVFSPSGAGALAIIHSLWSDMPKRKNPEDENEIISFSRTPNSLKYPWWQISPIYRSYIKGNPDSEFIKDGFLANMASWGLVINSFSELEQAYLDHLMKELGHDRVWTVGPLLPPDDEPADRGGANLVSAGEISSWLDTCQNNSVIYVCFGSQAVLNNKQMNELALGLERSGVKFLWSVKGATKGHTKGEYGVVPPGFEDRVAGRGLVVRDWVPQVLILRHPAVGAFLTHCGWNSILESLVAGVPMLAWPMGADQFVNATLLVDELKVAIRVCEGANTLPSSNELAQSLSQSMTENWAETGRARELRRAAFDAIKQGGSSYQNLDRLVMHLSQRAL